MRSSGTPLLAPSGPGRTAGTALGPVRLNEAGGVRVCGPGVSEPRASAGSGSDVDHHLVVPGVEGGHLLRREGPAAAAQLGHLGEEVLPGDARREEDEEVGRLAPVVAEAVHPALVHQREVTGRVRPPGTVGVDRQPACEHVERLGERLVGVRPGPGTVRREAVLDQTETARGVRAGRDHARCAGTPRLHHRVLGEGADDDRAGLGVGHGRHPGTGVRRRRPVPATGTPGDGSATGVPAELPSTACWLVSGPRRKDTDTLLGRCDTSVSRGPEHRIAALTLAALTFVAGLIGTANLCVDGTLHQGATRTTYTVAMAACLVAAAALAVRQRAGPWQTLGLVVLTEVVYVIVAFSVSVPAQATPLMLLFPSFVAAWFLGPWMLGATMVATGAACSVALAHTYDGALSIAVQVAIKIGRASCRERV